MKNNSSSGIDFVEIGLNVAYIVTGITSTITNALIVVVILWSKALRKEKEWLVLMGLAIGKMLKKFNLRRIKISGYM